MKITTRLVVLILLCIGISAQLQSATIPSGLQSQPQEQYSQPQQHPQPQEPQEQEPKKEQDQQLQQQSQQQQQKKQIKIINAHTHQVVEDAHYSYGGSTGFSDEKGIISLNVQAGLTLTISHLSFEPKVFNEVQLKQLIELGRIYLTPRATYRIEPVMVLALGTANHHSLEVGVSETDRVQHDAGALLKQINGISGIRKSGNYGFDPVFRGYKYDQLNIVFNGVQTATAACPNRMDPPVSQIALNQVERIEVLKGPHALRYGPAFGATINFIGNTLHEVDDPGWFGRVSGGGEGNGSIARTEAIVGTQNKDFLFSLNGAYSKGDDYKDGNGDKVASSFERGTFGVNAGGELIHNQWFDIAINRNFARDVDFPALPMDMRTDDTWTINVNNKSEFNGYSKLNTSLYATLVDHEMDNYERPKQGRMADAITTAKTESFGGRVEWNTMHENLQWYLGGDLKVHQASGTRTREIIMGPMAGKIFDDNVWQDGRVTNIGLFSEIHLLRNNMNYSVALRMDQNNADADKVDEAFQNMYSDLSPSDFNISASVGATRNWNNNWSLGMWLGRGVRSGGIAERYINHLPIGVDPYEMLGNPDIKPEVNHQLDLSLGWSTENTNLSVGLFGSLLNDYISSTIDPSLKPRMKTAPGVRRFVNIDKATMMGFDIAWHQQWVPQIKSSLSMNYTYGENDDFDEPLPEIAPMEVNVAIEGNFIQNRLFPKVALRHAMEQDRIAETFGEVETPDFTTVDINIRYLITNNISLTGGMSNVFDETYREHLSRYNRSTSQPIYAPGRNAFATLTFNW